MTNDLHTIVHKPKVPVESVTTIRARLFDLRNHACIVPCVLCAEKYRLEQELRARAPTPLSTSDKSDSTR